MLWRLLQILADNETKIGWSGVDIVTNLCSVSPTRRGSRKQHPNKERPDWRTTILKLA